MSSRKWKRVHFNDDPAREIRCYEYRDGDTVLCTIEQYKPPGSGHFGIWSVVGVTGANFPTKRDAQRYAEKQQNSGSVPDNLPRPSDHQSTDES